MSTAMSEKMPMTVHGKEMLETELKRLLHEERPSIIKAIEEARSHGDISENAEYEAAKDRQGMVEARISDIQTKIALSEVVNPAEIKADRVVFGATVTIKDIEDESKVTYQIVGVDEADVKSGKISIMSPIARSLIGKRISDIVTVHSPKGEKEYEVIAFKYQ